MERARTTSPPEAAPARRPAAKLTLQRAFAGGADLASEDGASADLETGVRGVLAAGGQPLDPAARSAMEARFGHDFSRVRVHADPAGARSARALNARAYTAGEHIVFASGTYAPGTLAGERLLAHELAHVVQQRTGQVDAGPGPGTVWATHPAHPTEQAAERIATEVTSATPSRRPAVPVAGAPRSGPLVVQRFLAGDEGHGGIEEPALEAAGFTKDEAKLTYYGNWLRDFSQLLHADQPEGQQAIFELIRILATGEFGRAPTDAEIGRYLPSEHVDNPAGGTSAENPTAPHHADMVKQLSHSTDPLAAGQGAFFDKEPGLLKTLQARAAASGLPVYIERAKEHAKEKIAEAVAKGRTEAGMRALGNALHQVEDYFAHSNFAEVALASLVATKALPAGNRLVEATHHYPGVDPAKVGTDPFGRPQIVTGTSIEGAGDVVGRWEVIKTELRSGELTKIFLRGLWIRYHWKLPLVLAKAAVEGAWGAGKAAGGFAGKWVGRVLGGAVGALGGLLGGAAGGAVAGFTSGHGFFGKLGGALRGLFGGAARGAASGARSGFETGGKVGEAVGGVAGGVAGLVGLPLALAATASFLFDHAAAVLLLGAPVLYAIDKAVQAIAGSQIKANAKKTIPEARAKGVPLPTHSQIAKDDPDHPLHAAAAALASAADTEIGRAMLAAWAPGAPPKAKQAPVDLVDRFLSHPDTQRWWVPVLTAAATKKKP
ncbi:MAG TPA: DUF4157 domain-containing protein [Actinomycetota bacterium]|nr:DUF4157 domain-containing protein [Actinomycetota bacterium]